MGFVCLSCNLKCPPVKKHVPTLSALSLRSWFRTSAAQTSPSCHLAVQQSVNPAATSRGQHPLHLPVGITINKGTTSSWKGKGLKQLLVGFDPDFLHGHSYRQTSEKGNLIGRHPSSTAGRRTTSYICTSSHISYRELPTFLHLEVSVILMLWAVLSCTL